MEVSSLTNPIPPTGGTNSTVPLSISGSLLPDSIPKDTKPSVPPYMDLPKSIFLGSFLISEIDVMGTHKFSFNTRETGLLQYFNPNIFFALGGSNFIPNNLVKPFYSKQGLMHYQLMFQPVKVSDSRVKLNVIYSFGDTNSAVYNRNAFANANCEIHLDSPDSENIADVPQHFVSNNIPMDQINISPTSMAPCPFVPLTAADVFISTPYQPNQIQPSTMEVLVYLLVTPENLLGFATKRNDFASVGEPTTTTTITPYFFT